ncbi:MAG: hypothetical protein AB2704_08640, partial [Candidatus Thiodiazotropha taylori]
ALRCQAERILSSTDSLTLVDMAAVCIDITYIFGINYNHLIFYYCYLFRMRAAISNFSTLRLYVMLGQISHP